MEQFATEEQQVEAIKRFWKEHGTAIIVGAALGLGGLWGWRAYSEAQIETKEAASVAYQNAVETFGTEGSDAKVKAFIEENKDSGYGMCRCMPSSVYEIQRYHSSSGNSIYSCSSLV